MTQKDAMLFNSYIFLFLFLPVCAGVFFALSAAAKSHRAPLYWLVFSSLVFYGYWNPVYLYLIGFSITSNYFFAALIARYRQHYFLLVAGVTFNLALIAYFKYAYFMVDNVNQIASTSYSIDAIVLPLAISFFTFQQIAYLVDVHKRRAERCDFAEYVLFVTFFPQLIAGPIVHHREMMPQFQRPATYRLDFDNLSIGLTIFFLGLFKKVALADTVAIYADSLFGLAESGTPLSFFEAWAAATAYSFEIYFDFSAYSDMAVGLARMLNIKLPINFNSPYKATNIVEFWRCWHMTLSRFLRDYLYVPLGGNRKGKLRRYLNLLLTMLIGGLWHGAAWNFVLWGGLHGCYLVCNHVWRRWSPLRERKAGIRRFVYRWVCRAATFGLVTIAWVYFRETDVSVATRIVETMLGFHGISLSVSLQPNFVALFGTHATGYLQFSGIFPSADLHPSFVLYLLVLLIAVWLMPNVYDWMASVDPVLLPDSSIRSGTSSSIQWRPSALVFIAILLIAFYSLSELGNEREFLYFQF
ncbi:MAG: MBOAT family protein [Pseudomonadota bacterium]